MAFFSLLLALTFPQSAEPSIQRISGPEGTTATLVQNAALGHTSQFLAADEFSGSLQDEQKSVFGQLNAALKDCGSRPADVVRLSIYARDTATAKATRQYLNDWFPPDAKPTISVVQTPLPNSRRLAIDAVFVAHRSTLEGVVIHKGKKGQPAHVSVLPQGDVVYVSGQAEPGELGTATRRTLESLQRTLEHLRLDRKQIVHIKCFLQPMAQVAVVNHEIEAFFSASPIPAVSHVEWIAGGTRPIEIEVVAAAPLTNTSETVSYFTPPDMKSSPVFSRVARIHGNRRVYVSALVSKAASVPRTAVHDIYQQLISTLKPTRSNLRHLAKATYYVSEPNVSAALNRIRPHYYDPNRPPAASKAMVAGVGSDRQTIAIDFIGAPEAPLRSELAVRAAQLSPTRRLVYKATPTKQLHLHVYEPDGHQATDRRPVFLAIHGGGWTGGSAQGFAPFPAHFAEQGMLGISLEYRLHSRKTGVSVFDCVKDARSAVRWVRSHATQLGADPDRIVVMGGSAGGHLSASTALFPSINDSGDDTKVSARPDAMILMYPVIDTSAAGYGQPKIGDRWKELSPVHNVKSGLPPALIFHGTGDDVTPFPAASEFHEKSGELGNISELIVQPAGRHGYIIFDPVELDRALAQMEGFLLRQKLTSQQEKPGE